MVFSHHPRSSQRLKLVDQPWYIRSNNNYMTASIPPLLLHSSAEFAASNHTAAHTKSMAEPRLPELLVLELHRDGGISKYRHYTIRGLYRYVLEAIADRTGVLQVAALAHHWRRATTYNSSSMDTSDLLLDADTNETSSSHAANAEPITYLERLGGYFHPCDMRRLVTPFSTSNEPELMVRRHVMLLNYDPLRAIILRDRLLVLVPDGADSLLTTLEQRVRGGREAMENSIFGTTVRLRDAEQDDAEDEDDPKTNPATRSVTANLTKKDTLPTPPSVSDISEKNDDNQTAATDTNGVDDDTNDEWHEMATREWVNIPFELQCADAVLHVVGSILSEETFGLQMAAEAFIACDNSFGKY